MLNMAGVMKCKVRMTGRCDVADMTLIKQNWRNLEILPVFGKKNNNRKTHIYQFKIHIYVVKVVFDDYR